MLPSGQEEGPYSAHSPLCVEDAEPLGLKAEDTGREEGLEQSSGSYPGALGRISGGYE